MSKIRKRWGEGPTDAGPFGYLTCRWRLGQGWHDVAACGEVVLEAAQQVLEQQADEVERECRLIGATGLSLYIAPRRPEPAYWLDRNAGINAPSSALHGCIATGADVVVCEVLGVPSKEWTSSMETRAQSMLLRLHAAMATP